MNKTQQIRDPELLSQLTFEPLTQLNWGKFVQLFGERGACGNCWCMWPRLKRQDYQEGKQNDGNKLSMKELVWSNKPTGILGFWEDIPIAWCAFAPREDFLKLKKSRVHKRIDDRPVWSIPCLFIDKNFRKMEVSIALLEGVIQYSRENNIEIIEAYPTIPTKGKLPDSFVWVGLYRSFEQAGFQIADRTSKNRPMVRYYIGK